MKQFKFNLEPVLAHKKRLHDKAQEVFVKAKEYCAQGELELRTLKEEKRQKRDDFKHQQQGALDVSTLVLHLRYLTHLGRMEKIKTDDVQKRQDEMSRCKDALIKVLRDKKTIEKLKEKKHRQYLDEVRVAEQKVIDETATGRFIRKAHEHGEI